MIKVLCISNLSRAALVLPMVAFGANAHAAQKPVTFVATASSDYVIEQQASIYSGKPVVNVEVDWKQTSNLTGSIWTQVGNRDGREIDITEAYSKAISKSFVLRALVAIYVYPDGGKPTLIAAVGASVVVEKFTIDFDVQGYALGQKTTNFRLAVTHAVKVGPAEFTVTLGKAWNTGELKGLNPYYGRISVPVGGGFTLGARGFVGAGRGGAVDLSKKF